MTEWEADRKPTIIAMVYTTFILATWLVFFAYVAKGQERKVAIEESSDADGLFYDKRLSSNGKVSCSTCHPAKHGYASDGLPLDLEGKPLALKAPSLVDAHRHKTYFHDGRARTLEAQIAAVLTNPREMGNRTVAEAAGRVGMSEEKLVASLAKIVRGIRHERTAFDEHVAGGRTMSASATRGWNLFRADAQCYLCHDPKNGFKDDKFHNTGAGVWKQSWDGKLNVTGSLGRFEVTKREKDWGAFKTPGLRGCKDTAPYMHDCSIKTLEEVAEFYDKGGVGSRDTGLDPLMRPLRLTRQQKRDLVAFLKEL